MSKFLPEAVSRSQDFEGVSMCRLSSSSLSLNVRKSLFVEVKLLDSMLLTVECAR